MNEQKIIKLIEKSFKLAQGEAASPNVALGVGDDCAAIRQRTGYETLVTTDTLAEGVHFNLDKTTAQFLAQKSACVSLSDIAAMGGRQTALFLSLSIPSTIDIKWLARYIRAFGRSASSYGAVVAGGNVSSSPSGLSITVTAVGEVKKGCRVDRSGARPGDLIYVTGTPGDSALGYESAREKPEQLLTLRKAADPAASLTDATGGMGGHYRRGQAGVGDDRYLRWRRPRFEARGRKLGGIRHARPGQLPLVERSQIGLRKDGDKAWETILAGGEDYELLFTVRPANRNKVERLITSGKLGAADIGAVEKGESKPLLIVAPSGKTLELAQYGWWHR